MRILLKRSNFEDFSTTGVKKKKIADQVTKERVIGDDWDIEGSSVDR